VFKINLGKPIIKVIKFERQEVYMEGNQYNFANYWFKLMIL